MKEREISLVAFLFEILLKWRMLIVAMVLGGILLGGYSYMKQEVNESELFVQLEENLTSVQKSNVKAVLGCADYQEYYSESFLMQIDANNAPTSELIFQIVADDKQKEKALVTVYKQMLKTGITEWLIQGGMDEKEASKLNELIMTEDESFNQVGLSLADKPLSEKPSVEEWPVEKNDLLYVRVLHIDEEKCKELAKQVSTYIFEQESELENVYGPYEVRLVSKSYATMLNEELLNSQRVALINLADGITYADQLKSALTADEKQYYNLLKAGVDIETVGESSEVPEVGAVDMSPSISVKYVVLGMVLFAFLYVFYVFVAFVINNKLRENDDFAEMFGIEQLGMISEKDDKKKFLGFVDRWIVALRDRNKRKFTEEESKEITAVAIKMAVKKFDGKEVCFIGCDVKKQTEDICSSIKAILEKEGIIVSVLDNVLYNAEEMGKLTDAKNVVIIEKIGATMYDEVAKELELLKRYNINVLGGVLVE